MYDIYDSIDNALVNMIQCDNNVFITDTESMPLYYQTHKNGEFYHDYDTKTLDEIRLECKDYPIIYSSNNKLYNAKNSEQNWYETWWFGAIAGVAGTVIAGTVGFFVKKCFHKSSVILENKTIENKIKDVFNEASQLNYSKIRNTIDNMLESVIELWKKIKPKETLEEIIQNLMIEPVSPERCTEEEEKELLGLSMQRINVRVRGQQELERLL